MASDDELLAAYLREVRELPVLGQGEEGDALARSRTRAGDETARRRLIEGYLELTALLAIRLAPDGMRPLDAIQEANLVLIRLVDDTAVTRLAARLTDAIVERFDELR